jgi:hypothetical protein
LWTFQAHKVATKDHRDSVLEMVGGRSDEARTADEQLAQAASLTVLAAGWQ